MIAVIDGRAKYVPLGYDSTADRWISLIGDRGRVGMMEWETAAKLCAYKLANNLEGIAIDARSLRSLSGSILGSVHSEDDKRKLYRLSCQLFDALEVAEIDARRLLDEPVANDILDIESEPDIDVPMCDDDALIGCVSNCVVELEALTDSEFTDYGIDTAIGILEGLRAMRSPPANGNNTEGGDNGGDKHG